MAQGLGCQGLTAEGPGSVPGWGTKIPQAVQLHGKEANIQDFPKSKKNGELGSSLVAKVETAH